MQAQDIRAAIAASPAVRTLVPDTFAVAAALSVGRTRLVPTEIGNGLVLETIGLAAGNALLDLIASDPAYRHVKPLLEQGRLDISSSLARATIDAMTDASSAAALKALAEVPDPVDELDVRRAIFSDQGELLV